MASAAGLESSPAALDDQRKSDIYCMSRTAKIRIGYCAVIVILLILAVRNYVNLLRARIPVTAWFPVDCYHRGQEIKILE